MTAICNCGVEEGQYHRMGCDMERCPFCSRQLVSCECDSTEEDFATFLEKKGRIPFILYPNHCSYCGKLWDETFMVPDTEWIKYIQPSQRDKRVCRECFDRIKAMIDKYGTGMKS